MTPSWRAKWSTWAQPPSSVLLALTGQDLGAVLGDRDGRVGGQVVGQVAQRR